MGRSDSRNLAVLQGFAPNDGDAWRFRSRKCALSQARRHQTDVRQTRPATALELLEREQVDPLALELMGPYLDAARLMGQRVGELHLALSSSQDDPDFAPEYYSPFYQRSSYQSMRNLLTHAIRTLQNRRSAIPKELLPQVQAVIGAQPEIIARFDAFLRSRASMVKMRCHGDLHLGQVLYTGKDFVIIDFEGEPARTLNERRRKRSALHDVAGMLRSFHYAALTATVEQLRAHTLGEVNFQIMEPWTNFWQSWASWAFLRGYLKTAENTSFIPRTLDEFKVMLDAFMMEKAVYELGYELNNRPEWLLIPLHGIASLLGKPSGEIRI